MVTDRLIPVTCPSGEDILTAADRREHATGLAGRTRQQAGGPGGAALDAVEKVWTHAHPDAAF